MNNYKKLLLALAIVSTSAAPPYAHADPAPGNAQVVQLVGRQPFEYRQEGDRFKRVGPLATTAVSIPAKVLSVSKKGYVEIQGSAGTLWLDKMDVKLDPPASLWSQANCSRQVTTQNSVKTHVGMGAGEGCKP